MLPAVEPVLGDLAALDHVFVVGGETASGRQRAFAEPLADQSAAFTPAPTCADEVAFWLYSSGSVPVSRAGEALPADVGKAWKAGFGVDIYDGVGSTEMLHIYLSNAPGDVRDGHLSSIDSYCAL